MKIAQLHVKAERVLREAIERLGTQAKGTASVEELRERWHGETAKDLAAMFLAELPAFKDAPFCPAHRVDMRLRVATRGPLAGRKFWGCHQWPRCRITFSHMDEATVADEQLLGRIARGQQGFVEWSEFQVGLSCTGDDKHAPKKYGTCVACGQQLDATNASLLRTGSVVHVGCPEQPPMAAEHIAAAIAADGWKRHPNNDRYFWKEGDAVVPETDLIKEYEKKSAVQVTKAARAPYAPTRLAVDYGAGEKRELARATAAAEAKESEKRSEVEKAARFIANLPVAQLSIALAREARERVYALRRAFGLGA